MRGHSTLTPRQMSGGGRRPGAKVLYMEGQMSRSGAHAREDRRPGGDVQGGLCERTAAERRQV